MKYRLLNYLVCPDCGGDLKISVFKENRARDAYTGKVKRCEEVCAFKAHSDGTSSKGVECGACYSFEIEAGLLSCKCNNIYPIADGIARMLPDAFHDLGGFIEAYGGFLPLGKVESSINGGSVQHSVSLQKKTKESFGYQWLRYNVNDEREDRKIFLSDSQLSGESLNDKMVLDAGCGMGRYTSIAAGMAREIIGLDISRSILKAYDKTKKNPSAHIIQGDILNLPFREKQFDVIYSLGVLHHTPDPRQAFLNLTQCLKEEGIISVWLYGSAGRFSDFKTNPLRRERKRYVNSNFAKRVHWLIVSLREIVYNAIRLVTARMYVPLLYLLCYPLAALGKVPLLKYFTASVHRNWRVRLQENFDWFSPQYQSHHTKEEVRGWFDAGHVEVVSLLEHGFIPKVGVKGRLKRQQSTKLHKPGLKDC